MTGALCVYVAGTRSKHNMCMSTLYIEQTCTCNLVVAIVMPIATKYNIIIIHYMYPVICVCALVVSYLLLWQLRSAWALTDVNHSLKHSCFGLRTCMPISGWMPAFQCAHASFMFTVTGQGQESTKRMIFGIVTRIDVLNFITSYSGGPLSPTSSISSMGDQLNGVAIRWVQLCPNRWRHQLSLIGNNSYDLCMP